MSEHARRARRNTENPGGVSRIGRAGGWWLALVVVCAVGLVAFGVLAFAGRPHNGPGPADPAAAGKRSATPRARASTVTPGASLFPSSLHAGLTSSPPPAPTRWPSPRPAPAPRPSLPAPAPTSPPHYLTLDPASGAVTLTPTWSASACPSGFQDSALLYALNADGTVASIISGTVSSVAAPFTGTLQGTVGRLLSFLNVPAGGTSTWVVGCFAGPGGTGAEQRAQSISVSLSADGSSYSTS